jgi:hypothetical protein
MRKIRTPYGVSDGLDGADSAAVRYAQGYEAALAKVVKIAADCDWNGADFTQAFCDEMNRLGVDLGPDPVQR